MPYIKIEVTREGVTREQKQALIAGVTRLITEVLDKDPKLTHVVIQEIELDDWRYAGEQVSVLREKGITAKKGFQQEALIKSEGMDAQQASCIPSYHKRKK
jgi:4-oxalocrotonate tautomerase